MRGPNVRFLSEARHAVRGFRTGVSLHSHTMHSRESLGFLPGWIGGVPILSWELGRLTRLYEAHCGGPPDFAAAYWTSPVSSLRALQIEQQHLEAGLSLHGIVSLSDHDNVDAGCELHALGHQVPISAEWTVPLRETFLHLGIHNLPPAIARPMMKALSAYTRRRESGGLEDLVAQMDAEPGVLIVLNHPLWDQAGIGLDRHHVVVHEFLRTMGSRIHALELNGLRPWSENRAVVRLAEQLNRPLISGGDRHGCEPNAVINLTNATAFGEFADEVRAGCSEVLFLPHYDEPLGLRITQALFDVLRDCPDLAPRGRWVDRVFYARPDGTAVPLSSSWPCGGPAVVRGFVRGLELVGHHRAQQVWRRIWRLARVARGRRAMFPFALSRGGEPATPDSVPLPPS